MNNLGVGVKEEIIPQYDDNPCLEPPGKVGWCLCCYPVLQVLPGTWPGEGGWWWWPGEGGGQNFASGKTWRVPCHHIPQVAIATLPLKLRHIPRPVPKVIKDVSHS